jgi:hypothetical protein
MANIPTATKCREYLAGYGINTEVLSRDWIDDERDTNVIPFVEHMVGASISTEETFVEYLNGTGKDVLFLSRRNVSEITEVKLVSGGDIDGTLSLSSIELIGDLGEIKAIAGLSEYYFTRKFPRGQKNIKITYKAGGTLDADVAMAIKKLTCVTMLDMIEGQTGGGNLAVQAYSKQYGDMGKYTNIRKRLSKQAMAILNRKKTSVVAS